MIQKALKRWWDINHATHSMSHKPLHPDLHWNLPSHSNTPLVKRVKSRNHIQAQTVTNVIMLTGISDSDVLSRKFGGPEGEPPPLSYTVLLVESTCFFPFPFGLGAWNNRLFPLMKYHHGPICFAVAVGPDNHPRLVRAGERDSRAFGLRVSWDGDLDSRETEHGRRLLSEGRKLVELADCFWSIF